MLLSCDIFSSLSPEFRQRLAYLEVHDVLSSTQSVLVARAKIPESHWGCVIAINQTAGYGTQNRAWLSSNGQVSFSWRGIINVPNASVGLLSLAAALSVRDALLALGCEGVGLKWPNDVYIHDKKLAGILVTVCATSENKFDIVLGMGLNRLRLLLPDAVAALEDNMQELPSLSGLIAALLNAWWNRQQLLRSEIGRNQLVSDWLSASIWLTKSVTITGRQRSVVGQFMGITSTGLLRVATVDGEQIFAAGEIQLRPYD